MMPYWVKSLSTFSAIFGISINPAKKWIIAHTWWISSPYYLLILDRDGNLKGAYTYIGASTYNPKFRNLLLGYESTISTFTALIQTT